MKLSLDTILAKLRPLFLWGKKYGTFLFVLVFLGIYVYMVQYIGQLIQNDPGQSGSESSLKPVNRLKIDQDAVQKMTDLEAQNIEVQALFDQARQNPFTE